MQKLELFCYQWLTIFVVHMVRKQMGEGFVLHRGIKSLHLRASKEDMHFYGSIASGSLAEFCPQQQSAKALSLVAGGV